MGTPPPVPIRGNRLTVTEKMVRSRMVEKGLTGAVSGDLRAVFAALNALETQTPQMQPQARALSAAVDRWLKGNHPGELSLLGSTSELQAIFAFTSRYPAPNAPAGTVASNTLPSSLKSIGVALYSVINRNSNFCLTIPQRLQNMRLLMDAFSQWLTANQADLQADNAFKGIFIAPEYFFTTPSPTGEREFLGLSTKNQIDLDLIQLSKTYPEILLVPGTSHYDVQLTQKQKEEAGFQLLKAAKDRILRENALAKPTTVLGRSMSHQPSGTFSKVPSMNTLATTLLDKTTAPRKVHNVTSLILNGKVWGTYDKHTDFYETKSTSPDQSMFVPGTQDECPEIGDGVRKFRFGVEICFDHGNAVLKRRSPPNLHFHIVVSDSVPNNPSNMAMRNGGYFLHASTDHSKTVVYRRNDSGQLVDGTATLRKQSHPLGADFLDFFLIQLPRPLPPPPPPRV